MARPEDNSALHTAACLAELERTRASPLSETLFVSTPAFCLLSYYCTLYTPTRWLRHLFFLGHASDSIAQTSLEMPRPYHGGTVGWLHSLPGILEGLFRRFFRERAYSRRVGIPEAKNDERRADFALSPTRIFDVLSFQEKQEKRPAKIGKHVFPIPENGTEGQNSMDVVIVQSVETTKFWKNKPGTSRYVYSNPALLGYEGMAVPELRCK